MQPNYPPQQYAPQYPQQPQGYPVAPPQQPQGYPAYPPQGYAPQPPAYPQQPQGYPGAYTPPAPPQVPLPTGSLDTFYQQPSSSGGPSFKFLGKPVGTSYAGFVARPLTDADVRADTDEGGNVRAFKDGRPKFVMVVPMLVQQSQEFPEGQAGWWVKGQARDELARAMAEVGAPAGAPEGGAFIQVTLVAHQPVPNRNPRFVYRVNYQRPQGAAPAAAPGGPVEQVRPEAGAYEAPEQPIQAVPYQPAQQYQPAPAAPQGYVPTPYGPAPVAAVHPEYAAAATAPGAQVYVQQPPAAPVQPMPQPAPMQAPQPMPQPMPQAAPQGAVPAGFNEDQAALFAKLTGQKTAA